MLIARNSIAKESCGVPLANASVVSERKWPTSFVSARIDCKSYLLQDSACLATNVVVNMLA